ncbi:hypothetical protein J3P96_17650 [Pseudomonas sp. R3-56]|uniref:hypothetical protein n=1 Tax=Pseudomonas sp. R3-56 TaxID=2817401 RepID=UPI003DA878C4
MSKMLKPTSAMVTVEDKKNQFQGTFLAYVIFASIAAYTCQPLIKFANPPVLGTGGVFLGFGIVSVYRVVVLGAARAFLVLGCFAALAGFGAIAVSAHHAIGASDKNDAQCLTIQAKILADGVPDEKAAAAFSALGCRPQYPEKVDYFDRFR